MSKNSAALIALASMFGQQYVHYPTKYKPSTVDYWNKPKLTKEEKKQRYLDTLRKD